MPTQQSPSPVTPKPTPQTVATPKPVNESLYGSMPTQNPNTGNANTGNAVPGRASPKTPMYTSINGSPNTGNKPGPTRPPDNYGM